MITNSPSVWEAGGGRQAAVFQVREYRRGAREGSESERGVREGSAREEKERGGEREGSERQRGV
jgi:hypothetical protein